MPVLVPVPTIVPRSDAAKRRLAAQHWGASKAAESLYVLAIGHIMSAAHNAVLRVVQREHLASGTRQDADKPRGLNGRLLHDIVTWQKPRVSDAFSKLAKATNAKSLQTAALYGVHVRHEAGIEGVIETARAANVALVTNATADFLDQIRQALEEHEGETSDEISAALQDRVGVSKSRGTLIARTETLKLNSQVVEHRARSAGAYTYRWSTSLDERVRPMHADLEGLPQFVACLEPVGAADVQRYFDVEWVLAADHGSGGLDRDYVRFHRLAPLSFPHDRQSARSPIIDPLNDWHPAHDQPGSRMPALASASSARAAARSACSLATVSAVGGSAWMPFAGAWVASGRVLVSEPPAPRTFATSAQGAVLRSGQNQHADSFLLSSCPTRSFVTLLRA